MSVTYTHNGSLTLSGLIYFLEKIQDERKSETVRHLEAETYAGATTAMQGQSFAHRSTAFQSPWGGQKMPDIKQDAERLLKQAEKFAQIYRFVASTVHDERDEEKFALFSEAYEDMAGELRALLDRHETEKFDLALAALSVPYASNDITGEFFD